MDEPTKTPELSDRQRAVVGRAGTLASRSALLDAVGVVLARVGLEGLSLRKVAAQAGLSHAAPGVLFGGRAAMLTAYAAEGFRELGRRMDVAELAATSGQQALAATGQAYVLFAVDEPLRFQVMFRTDRLLPRDPDYVGSCREAFVPLQRAIDRGIAEGSVDASAAQDLMLSAWSLVHGLANLWFSKHLAGRVRPDPREIAARVTRLFASAMMSGDQPPLPDPSDGRSDPEGAVAPNDRSASAERSPPTRSPEA